MYRVGHNQKHLADEFMANPFGRASPELQRILMVFRGGAAAGKYILVCTRPHQEWMLGQLPAKRGEPLKLLPEHRFTSLAEAERAVFRMRWREATGHELG
jgi:hypothetical protein